MTQYLGTIGNPSGASMITRAILDPMTQKLQQQEQQKNQIALEMIKSGNYQPTLGGQQPNMMQRMFGGGVQLGQPNMNFGGQNFKYVDQTQPGQMQGGLPLAEIERPMPGGSKAIYKNPSANQAVQMQSAQLEQKQLAIENAKADLELRKQKLAGDPMKDQKEKLQIQQQEAKLKIEEAKLKQQSDLMSKTGGYAAQRLQFQKDRLDFMNRKMYQTEWDKIAKEMNPTANARPTTPLGRAALANYQANRALRTLDDPKVTNQEFKNVLADVAGIYKGGSPTDLGMSEQQFNTITEKLAGMLTSVTGDPKDAVTPQIKDRIIKDLVDMKKDNYEVIGNNLNILEAQQSNIIEPFRKQWEESKALVMKDNYSPQSKIEQQYQNLSKVGNKKESSQGAQDWQKSPSGISYKVINNG